LKKDILGNRFNKLTVIANNGLNRFGKTNWLCQCDCGKRIVLTTSDLISGNRVACGKCSVYFVYDTHVECRMKNRIRFKVDLDDINRVNEHEWFYSNGYIKALINDKWVTLHRFIMNPSAEQIVDHIDGDKLNNMKENLRLCSKAENQRNQKIHKNNTSGYKGVRWNEKDKRWRAYIRKDSKSIYIGNFKELKEAVIAYNNKAIELFGEFAKINQVPEGD